MPLDPILFRAQHIFSIKGQIVNKLGIVDPNKGLSPHNYWPLPLQCESGRAQDSNEWAWLDANKTLFIKGGRKPDLADSQLADPLSPSVSWEDLQWRGLSLLLAASCFLKLSLLVTETNLPATCHHCHIFIICTPCPLQNHSPSPESLHKQAFKNHLLN